MNAFNLKKSVVAAVAAALLVGAGAASAQVVGGGATLPEDLYNGSTGTNGILTKSPLPAFNFYVGVGSGAGKRAFFNNNPAEFGLAAGTTVDYAGSDSLVTAAERVNYNAHATLGHATFGDLIQIPTVLTSVTVPYNVPGMPSLELTSQELADIFARRITNWQDVGGPNQPITVIFRSESSGTTEIFLRHLKAIDPTSMPNAFSSTFATAYGISATTPPAGYLSAAGSDGVVSLLNSTPYSITYVSPDKVAFDDGTKVAALEGELDGEVQFLLPTQTNVQAAVNDNPELAPPTGAAAENAENWGIGYVASGISPLAAPTTGYPIVGVTSIILSQCYASSGDQSRIREFVRQHYNTAVNDGAINTHSFIKLPDNWRTAVYNTFYDASSSLRIGNCTGVAGRPQ